MNLPNSGHQVCGITGCFRQIMVKRSSAIQRHEQALCPSTIPAPTVNLSVQCDPATWTSLMPVYNSSTYCQFIRQLLESIYTRFIIAVNYSEHGWFDILTAVLMIIHVCCDMTPCPPARSKSTYQTAVWLHLQSSRRRANPIRTV